MVGAKDDWRAAGCWLADGAGTTICNVGEDWRRSNRRVGLHHPEAAPLSLVVPYTHIAAPRTHFIVRRRIVARTKVTGAFRVSARGPHPVCAGAQVLLGSLTRGACLPPSSTGRYHGVGLRLEECPLRASRARASHARGGAPSALTTVASVVTLVTH